MCLPIFSLIRTQSFTFFEAAPTILHKFLIFKWVSEKKRVPHPPTNHKFKPLKTSPFNFCHPRCFIATTFGRFILNCNGKPSSCPQQLLHLSSTNSTLIYDNKTLNLKLRVRDICRAGRQCWTRHFIWNNTMRDTVFSLWHFNCCLLRRRPPWRRCT